MGSYVEEAVRGIEWWKIWWERRREEVSALGIRVSERFTSFGFRGPGFGFRVSGSGFRVLGFEFRGPGLRFRVSGFGLRFGLNRVLLAGKLSISKLK